MKGRSFTKFQAMLWGTAAILIGLSAETMVNGIASCVIAFLALIFCARMAYLNVLLYDAMEEK